MSAHVRKKSIKGGQASSASANGGADHSDSDRDRAAGTESYEDVTIGGSTSASTSSAQSSKPVLGRTSSGQRSGRNKAHRGGESVWDTLISTFQSVVMMRETKAKEDPPISGAISPGRRASASSPAPRDGIAGLLNGVGLTPRKAGTIAILTFVLITLARWMLPSSDGISSGPHHDSSGLTPRDYLNASQADPAPFDFCPVFGPGDPVAERRGQWGLLKSRLHQGSNARVQRVIQKALSGMPVTISVLGGSVSACHGAGDDPISARCYPSKFFAWWNTIFPHPASELTNGASRKTDSAYFAYCAAHHLPDHTDLVILEFDSSDPNDPEWLSHFELLVRSILVRPDMPAVIILGHFSPQVQAQNGFAGPELLHTVVAQFYDVPHISAKGLLYHDYLANPEAARSTYYTDPILANPAGHDLIADVLISYMQSQICQGWAATMGHAFDVPYMGSDGTDTSTGGPQLLGGVGLRKGIPGQEPGDGESTASESKYAALKVPSARLSDRPSDILQFREIEPFCVSANDLINPLPPSLFYGSGWHPYHPAKGAANEDRHYWYAEQPTSRLRIPVRLGAGDVGIYYLQSPEDRPLGRAMCWVDDNTAGAVELSGTADVPDVVPTLTIIDRHVSRGSHFVECALMGDAGTSTPPFKLLAVFTT